MCLKTDSFVVETNVHFPTDYNILWDSARKCLDMICLLEKHNDKKLPGWRKKKDWYRTLKNQMRAVGKACSSGGKNKTERVKVAVENYLTKAKLLLKKLNDDKDNLPQISIALLLELEKYKALLKKHIDLLERRIIKGEKIPHEEKLFSIFEQYTEWVTKGKKRPSVELGKKLSITTDQNNLIVDYHIMENESDSQIIPDLSKRICSKYSVKTWSFDKGYWHADNKELLKEQVETLVMPKKGKCNTKQAEEQSQPVFKKFRNKHSAVESNINELEHRGLDRCPDKGYANFKRYVALAVCAYNLKKTGEELLRRMRAKEASIAKRKAA